ncbi:Unannotated [Lentimonas sp. CC4]|nr:Unannotated [Lentimonas sp. CC4]CAA6686123.1 Unannotated [Lentimonas sp. CC6]CAA7074155.1 Unannotated [Lentimonas sp. CC4]CAA7171513.1 Unannotated [Lentimonas sp. CC21]CAA7181991.1 Unannotated [Lentimonas sp. CC8]
MKGDHLLQKLNPYAVVFCLYGLSVLLSYVITMGHPHHEYYSAATAYLFGFFYLPGSFASCFSALGINKIIGLSMLIAYWPANIFLTYKYIKNRELKWLLPLILIIILPAIKIGECFINTMSV